MEFFMQIYSNLLYIGPGISGGVFVAIIGIISALAISLFAICWYPLKKIMLTIINFFK